MMTCICLRYEANSSCNFMSILSSSDFQLEYKMTHLKIRRNQIRGRDRSIIVPLGYLGVTNYLDYYLHQQITPYERLLSNRSMGYNVDNVFDNVFPSRRSLGFCASLLVTDNYEFEQ